MLNLLKKYKMFIIIAAVPYILYILFMILPSSYKAYLIGDIKEVNKTIEVEINVKNKGTYNSTSVSAITDITLFQKVVFSSMNSCIVMKETTIDTTLTHKELDMRGKIEHDASVNYSIITAYNKAGIALNYEYRGMYVYFIDELSDDLMIGDVILGSSIEEVNELMSNFKIGQEINILRNEEEITVKPKSVNSLLLKYDYYELGEADVKFTIHSSNNQGPSAGFMQTLALYDDLLDEDFTNGLKIAGTGTMRPDEKVGAIGAVNLKIETAHYNKVDIFFAPTANEEEAKEAYRRLKDATKTKMKLVFVDTLDDAIRYLKDLHKVS